MADFWKTVYENTQAAVADYVKKAGGDDKDKAKDSTKNRVLTVWSASTGYCATASGAGNYSMTGSSCSDSIEANPPSPKSDVDEDCSFIEYFHAQVPTESDVENENLGFDTDAEQHDKSSSTNDNLIHILPTSNPNKRLSRSGTVATVEIRPPHDPLELRKLMFFADEEEYHYMKSRQTVMTTRGPATGSTLRTTIEQSYEEQSTSSGGQDSCQSSLAATSSSSSSSSSEEENTHMNNKQGTVTNRGHDMLLPHHLFLGPNHAPGFASSLSQEIFRTSGSCSRRLLSLVQQFANFVAFWCYQLYELPIILFTEAKEVSARDLYNRWKKESVLLHSCVLPVVRFSKTAAIFTSQTVISAPEKVACSTTALARKVFSTTTQFLKNSTCSRTCVKSYAVSCFYRQKRVKRYCRKLIQKFRKVFCDWGTFLRDFTVEGTDAYEVFQKWLDDLFDTFFLMIVRLLMFQIFYCMVNNLFDD
ncbi:unnamed protein product [Amoebophrya sp. A120]|nr:unnamed protein product [Amoebophrya sp. A120]|eukprot:GSA120T00015742001.1